MRTLNVIALMLALVYGCFAVELTLGTQTSVLLNATAGTGSVSFLLNSTSSVAGTDSVSYNISSVGTVNVTAGSHSFVNVTSALFVVDHCAWETLEVVINATDVAEVDITAKNQAIEEVSSTQFSHVTKPNTNQYNLISFEVTEAPLNVALSTNNGTVQAFFQDSTYPGATCSTANCTATDGNCTVNIATNGTWHILVVSADAAAEWSVLLGENNTIPTTTTTTTTGNETTTTTTGGLTTTGNTTTGNTTTTGGNTTTTGGLTTTGNSTTTGNANTTTTTTTSTGDLTTGPASTTTTTTSSSSTTTTTTTDDSGGGSSDGWKVAVGILVPVGVIAIAGGVGLWWYKKKNSRGFHTV